MIAARDRTDDPDPPVRPSRRSRAPGRTSGRGSSRRRSTAPIAKMSIVSVSPIVEPRRLRERPAVVDRGRRTPPRPGRTSPSPRSGCALPEREAGAERRGAAERRVERLAPGRGTSAGRRPRPPPSSWAHDVDERAGARHLPGHPQGDLDRRVEHAAGELGHLTETMTAIARPWASATRRGRAVRSVQMTVPAPKKISANVPTNSATAALPVFSTDPPRIMDAAPRQPGRVGPSVAHAARPAKARQEGPW